jgi:hypothetical protein
MIDGINTFLRQDVAERVSFEAGMGALSELLEETNHETI